ncbi:hypothetical protein ROZALSC1DRAFT_27027 [Rozella allomycis CSF55]|uniref:Uncharacterized protein n=1 Tax=Rozella allomycis (strain CSF55) TaxID=988480 RepID=A0A075ATB8_ROZAC|nr:hypothetical protein O9G_000251 [Rozella allomycis CSF55]RKP21571.1 hypothetical protein ROZALSC1DRAFT_27027 [Rozella allomycis CSF55]|eukprot:EPZ31772.1 hypothetical protein O9G_000251 [Rozella allomycis CSF55]
MLRGQDAFSLLNSLKKLEYFSQDTDIYKNNVPNLLEDAIVNKKPESPRLDKDRHLFNLELKYESLLNRNAELEKLIQIMNESQQQKQQEYVKLQSECKILKSEKEKLISKEGQTENTLNQLKDDLKKAKLEIERHKEENSDLKKLLINEELAHEKLRIHLEELDLYKKRCEELFRENYELKIKFDKLNRSRSSNEYGKHLKLQPEPTTLDQRVKSQTVSTNENKENNNMETESDSSKKQVKAKTYDLSDIPLTEIKEQLKETQLKMLKLNNEYSKLPSSNSPISAKMRYGFKDMQKRKKELDEELDVTEKRLHRLKLEIKQRSAWLE